MKEFLSGKIFRWLVAGALFAAVGLVLLKVFAGTLAWPYTVATLCSGEIVTIFRYLVVDRWVFSHRRPTWTRLAQYHVANGIGFGIWWSAANALKLLGVQYLVASVLAMCFSVGFNLLSNFLWIWRKPAPQPR